MPLSEEQIIRYSRQILLPGLGGKGQERLLGGGVTLTGEGGAQWVAAAYLAAGGAPLEARRPTVSESEPGFLFDRKDVGGALAPALKAALLDANPDACQPCTARGSLGELPASFSGPGPWVALGYEGTRGAVLFRSAEGCSACFLAKAGELSNGPQGAGSTLLGSLGALVYQRLVLGLGPALGGLSVEESGEVEPLVLPACTHKPGQAP